MTRQQVKRNIPRKLGLLGGIVAVGLMVGSALSFHNGTVAIEMDGNVANDAAAGVDWATLFTATGADAGVPADDQLGAAGNDIDRDFVKDFIIGATGPDNSYHEPSNKDNQPIFATGGSDVWGCGSASNPTDKDDILNAYAIAYTGQGEDVGDLILSFGVERFDDSGTAYLGFWVFQKDVACNLATSKFTGGKTDGDILLLANFSNGGDNVTINAFAWHPGTPANSADGTFTTIGTGVGCNLAVDPVAGTPGTNMCAITNGIDNQNVAVPWPTEDKKKPGVNPPNTLEPPEFVEGAINLTDAFAAINQTPPACFGSFMAETRSSDSLSATLKDFALGDLNTCNGSVKIEGTQTNRVGVEHTFTVTATQSTGGGTVPATNGHATVTLTGSNGIVAADIDINEADSTCDDAGDNLNAAGQCVIKFVSTETGKVTGHVSVDINLGGGSILTRDTDPATTTIGAGPGGSETPAVKTWVDAEIDITGDGTNRIGVNHSFTATVKTDSGNGQGLVAAVGQAVAIQKVDANGALSIPAGTQNCTTIAGGVCSVTFTSNLTGTTTGTASATVTLAGLTFGITTGTDASIPANQSVLKTWVHATIDITGDGTNRIGVNHSFTATVKTDSGDGNGLNATIGQLVSIQKVDANGAASVPAGTQTCTTIAGGVCSVTFTSNLTGTTTGTASTTVTLAGLTFSINTGADASIPANQSVLKTWVDATIGITGDDTNSIEESHTFTVLVKKDLGNGSGLVPAGGEDVNVTLDNTLGADYVIDEALTTCDVVGSGDTFNHVGADTDATTGECIVVFTSFDAGTVTGSAVSSIVVGGLTINLSTDDAGSTGDTVKVFLDGSIRWLKHDGDGNELGGATFLVCRSARLDSDTGLYVAEDVNAALPGNQPFCFTVRDNDGVYTTDPYDSDGDPGQLEVIDLVLGQYNVTETIPPAGYHIGTVPGAGPFSFPDMYINPSPPGPVTDVELTEIFVNIKAFRIIVITCDDITHELIVSTITLEDGTPVDSMSAADLASWNLAHGQNVTEAEICGGDVQLTDPSIGGAASFGDLPDGTYNLNVIIPKAS